MLGDSTVRVHTEAQMFVIERLLLSAEPQKMLCIPTVEILCYGRGCTFGLRSFSLRGA